MNILQKVKSNMELSRQNAKLNAKKVLDEVLKNNLYYDLYKKENNLVVNIAKIEFLETKADKEREELENIKRKKEQVLHALNINPKDLEPKYNCKLCQDTGYVNDKMCACLKKAVTNELIKLSGMNLNPDRNFNNVNFGIFSDSVRANMQKIYDKLHTVTQKYPDTKIKSVYIAGNTGTGKTYLSECVANAFIERGFTVYYTTAFNLNNNFLKYHTTFDASKTQFLSPVLDCDALFIDDLGTEPILKNVTLEYLWLVLNERMQKGAFTFINSNLLTKELRDRYGDRIFSRLMNKSSSIILKIEGEDLRLKSIK
ncbi:MAG: ATP-binding protein [Clostridia bacterium]|jgi:DNA replication protein DnaC|nr:ATP-binding protein [Clostridia bacterium]